MKNKRGFTLVELLVVISIIALLLSILMPSLNKVREQGKSVVCAANLHQFGLVFAMYAQNNNDRFMPYSYYGDPSTSKIDYFWMECLRSYYSNIDKLRFCPSAMKTTNLLLGTAKTAWQFKFKGLNGQKINDYGSYGINCWILNAKSPASKLYAVPPFNDPSYFWCSPGASGASNIPLLLDAGWVDGWPLESDRPPVDGGGTYGVGSTGMSRYCIDRHSNAINSSFLDISVRKIPVTELWNLKWHRNFQQKGKMTIPWAR
jgi:prepilin-type N-terminal cleavage/methylation domain-containing protein